jgi:inorganic pyrophosphatase
MNYWESLEKLLFTNGITIDRPKGTKHPKYPDFVYVVDYGFINNTRSMDNNDIDVFVGEGDSNFINGIFCTIDMLKNDSEIKVVLGCSKAEIEVISEFLNNSQYMKALYIERSSI